ncbi:hypothetical protein IQ22_01702 [Pseudomonas duriflava]|uniref:Uncharacterized protein n=1 Tax=Pseudomonas duriflava TaxID=459528 RepID=A0A562QDM0_9PSED|nr:hypothetical protein IQ22_01702 [Pseudomonas duriflava]
MAVQAVIEESAGGLSNHFCMSSHTCLACLLEVSWLHLRSMSCESSFVHY